MHFAARVVARSVWMRLCGRQVERRAVPALDEAPWYVDCVRFGRTLLRFDNAS
jgi:hypothetical protein